MKLQSALQLWIAASASPVRCLLEDKRRHPREMQREKALDRLIRYFPIQETADGGGPLTRVLRDGNQLFPMREGDKAVSQDSASLKDSNHGSRRLLNGRKVNKRVANHQRQAKGSSKTKSTKAAKNELQILRKKQKGTKGLAAPEILCFLGTYQDVTAACYQYNADCCVGEGACVWELDPFRPAIICQGGCVGKQACREIPAGSYIVEYACRDDYACSFVGYSSTKKDPVRIGRGSCSGRAACAGICYSSSNCQVKIEASACIGESSCNTIAFYAPAVEAVNVGQDACQDDLACYNLGWKNTNLVQIDIGSGSCASRETCLNMGYKGRGTSIGVGSNSCVSPGSCETFGLTASDIAIGKGTCVGYGACYKVGYASSSAIKLEDDSCQGDYSCTYVGENTFDSVTVNAGACTYADSCYGVGRQVVGDRVVIGKDACNSSPSQCSGSIYNECLYTKSIPKDAQSCSG